ncbi:hypothetical protein RF55_7700 [Lasius niger]|uniref:Uncharacterized protein n=1 Tax=Lasius niger TaxID=67767 RepID=A0A0J7KPQ4_LASNI|nr:hypothetical protein RF55_7700 [Lasius niger]
MPTWINLLRKDQVVGILANHGIDTTGTLDELRRRFRILVAQTPTLFTALTSTVIAEMPPVDELQNDPLPSANVHYTDHTKVVNQIRKWGCYFDRRDPMALLESVDELRDGIFPENMNANCDVPPKADVSDLENRSKNTPPKS